MNACAMVERCARHQRGEPLYLSAAGRATDAMPDSPVIPCELYVSDHYALPTTSDWVDA